MNDGWTLIRTEYKTIFGFCDNNLALGIALTISIAITIQAIFKIYLFFRRERKKEDGKKD